MQCRFYVSILPPLGCKSKISNACKLTMRFVGVDQAFSSVLYLETFLRMGTKSLRRILLSSRVASVLSLSVIQLVPNIKVTRFWIETAHKKLNWKVPSLLRITMDVLDDTLDDGCCFHETLARGDILVCNNANIAHGRGMPFK